MKESIDLTEHRDFREDRVAKSPVKKYPHKSLPWIKAGDFELAEKRSQLYNSSNYFYSTTSSNQRTWTVRWDEEENILDDVTDVVQSFMDVSNSFSTTSDLRYIRAAEKWLSSSSFYYYDSDNLIAKKLSVFPLGHKRDIIENRAIEFNTPKYASHHIKHSYRCKNCGTKVSRTPWHDSFNCICDTCKEKEDRLDREFMFERHKVFKKKSGKKCQIGRRDLVFDDQKFASVPCLSRRIPTEKKERIFPKRYNVLDTPYHVDRGRLYNMLLDMRQDVKVPMRKRSVFYKGRELQRREEPWQPNGRVRQDYDRIFEDTDWRDMLRHRIGTLDGPILSDKSYSPIRMTAHRLIDFVGDNMIDWETI